MRGGRSLGKPARCRGKPAGCRMSRKDDDTSRKARGARAEALAAAFLEKQGLRVIERNWRCRFGELDLVLREGDMIVMAEVRLRTHSAFGGAAASIDHRKQAKLAATARAYLAGLANSADRPCRFDVILMADDEGRDIEWIRNAFDAP